jgi:hypothetical protein
MHINQLNAIQNNKTTTSEINNLNFMHVIMFQAQSDFSHVAPDWEYIYLYIFALYRRFHTVGIAAIPSLDTATLSSNNLVSLTLDCLKW